MAFLSAAAAFAVLMIIFSTAITGITESYLRITSIRAKVLSKSVLQFLQQDPTIQRFAKQSLDTYIPNLIETALNKVNAGKMVTGFDRVTLLAMAEAQKDEIQRKTNELADKAEAAAKDASAQAAAAVGTDAHAEMVKQATNAENAAAEARAAADDFTKKRFEQAEKARVEQAESLKNAQSKAEDNQIKNAYDTLTLNQSLGESYNWAHKLAKLFRLLLPVRHKDLKRVEKLSTYSFLQRLAKTAIGLEIAKSGEEIALRTLTMGFERYVAASNEVFRKHAQATTMILSIVFALAFNIDAVRVFQHLVDNPQFSMSLIEKGEEAAEENRKALQNLNATLERLETNTSADAENVEEAVSSASKAIADAKAQIADLDQTTDLPIGWKEYPYNGTNGAEDSGDACFKSSFFDCGFADAKPFGKWLFGTLLAGFLIGLGGPFWYRVFASISHVMHIVRTFRGDPRKEAIETNMPKDQPASQELVAAVLNTDKTKDDELMTMFRASTGRPLDEFPAIKPKP